MRHPLQSRHHSRRHKHLRRPCIPGELGTPPGSPPAYGRTLAVRPPVFPPVGTFFFRVRARPSCLRPFRSPIPFPLSLRVPSSLALGCLPSCVPRGRVFWAGWCSSLGVGRVPPGGVLSGWGVVGVRGVLCLRAGVALVYGVGLLRLRLLQAWCFFRGGWFWVRQGVSLVFCGGCGFWGWRYCCSGGFVCAEHGLCRYR